MDTDIPVWTLSIRTISNKGFYHHKKADALECVRGYKGTSATLSTSCFRLPLLLRQNWGPSLEQTNDQGMDVSIEKKCLLPTETETSPGSVDHSNTTSDGEGVNTLTPKSPPGSVTPENSSLGLLLSDITSLILLSLSTDRFLQKSETKRPLSSATSKEAVQLLEAAGSTIDVLYDLLQKDTSRSRGASPSDFENTLVKVAAKQDVSVPGGTSTSATDLFNSSTSSSCHSGEYLSCESELSRSLEQYRSFDQLIHSPRGSWQDFIHDGNKKNKHQNGGNLSKVTLEASDTSRSLGNLHQRSSIAFDSGIASPSQSLYFSRQSHEFSRAKDDSFFVETPRHHKQRDVIERVTKLKITVDQKLRDSLANLSNLYTENTEMESLREHIKNMQERYERSSTDEWKSGQALYDVIMDKALATSVLAMENAQLGAEVSALKQELHQTYVKVKHQKDHKDLFAPRSCLSSHMSHGTGNGESSDSDQSSSSDISTPDTQLLSSYVNRHGAHRGDTTPDAQVEVLPGMSSQKRKLRPPPELKGPNYLSITNSSCSSEDLDSIEAVGCCQGLFSCLSRGKPNKRPTKADI